MSSDLEVSDRIKNSPSRMDTAQTTPQSTSSDENRMDIDSPPSTTRYHNRYADDFLPSYVSEQENVDRSPGSEMSIYTSTQTTTVPPPHARLPHGQFPSPVPFNIQQRSTHPETHTTTPAQSSKPAIKPISEITVAVGEENTVFTRVCDTLDNALAEWEERVSDEDKEHNPSTDVIVLNIPSYLSERIIYGKRPGGKQYWEGDLDTFAGAYASSQIETQIWATLYVRCSHWDD